MKKTNLRKEMLNKQWQENLNKLSNFLKANNGKYPSATTDNVEEKSLYNWYCAQRREYKLGRLEPKRIQALNDIGFKWTAYDDWNKNFNELDDFLKKNDGKYPSINSESSEERLLARWLSAQRRFFRQNKLSELRTVLLINIGVSLTPRDNQWLQNYNDFKKFLGDNKGKYPSSTSQDKREVELALWGYRQRTMKNQGKLSQEKEKMLDKIQFSWNLYDEKWQHSFKEFQKFLEEHNGKYPNQDSKDEKEKELAIWVLSQKLSLKNGKMSLNRYKILKRNNFIFNAFEERYLKQANAEFARYADNIYCRK